MGVITILIFSFFAGFLGTIVMTFGQEIEIRINKRPISYSPAIAVFKILHLDFDALSLKTKVVLSYLVHFAYGTFWGFPLTVFYFLEITNFFIIVPIYFFIVLTQGWIVLPLLGIVGPPWAWGWKSVVTEMIHKVVFSVATTLIFFTFI